MRQSSEGSPCSSTAANVRVTSWVFPSVIRSDVVTTRMYAWEDVMSLMLTGLRFALTRMDVLSGWPLDSWMV